MLVFLLFYLLSYTGAKLCGDSVTLPIFVFCFFYIYLYFLKLYLYIIYIKFILWKIIIKDKIKKFNGDIDL